MKLYIYKHKETGEIVFSEQELKPEEFPEYEFITIWEEPKPGELVGRRGY